MQDVANVWNTIRHVIEERLAPTQIVDVETEEDVDHDGDEIVRVRIIFAAESGRPKAEDVVGLTGLVREPLLEPHRPLLDPDFHDVGRTGRGMMRPAGP